MVAPDLRCHGQTQAEDEADLSAATLAADVVAIWRALFGGGSGGSGGGAAEGAGGPEDSPPTVLVGHSMGGAIAVHAATLGGARWGAMKGDGPWYPPSLHATAAPP